jgi:hypothetical protein
MKTSVQAAAALKNLPPFPPVAAKVMALLQEEAVSFPGSCRHAQDRRCSIG